MRLHHNISTVLLFIAVAMSVCLLSAQTQGAKSILESPKEVGYKVNRLQTSSPTNLPDSSALPVPQDQWQAYKQMIASARSRFATINRDFGSYVCVLTMRETIDGELQDIRRMQMLFRAYPYSIYLKYISPDDVVGREILFVEGKYNGRLIVTKGGLRPALAHITRAVSLDAPIVKSETTHCVADLGVASMMQQLLDVAEFAEQFPNCKIDFIENARVDNRPCTVIQITHAPKSDKFPFYKGQIFIDNQWQIPVRYICYNWPDEVGNVSVMEEFTYTHITPISTTSDFDFDFRNPRYGFKKDLEIPK